jgi:hypothetical protein
MSHRIIIRSFAAQPEVNEKLTNAEKVKLEALASKPDSALTILERLYVSRVMFTVLEE